MAIEQLRSGLVVGHALLDRHGQGWGSISWTKHVMRNVGR